MPGAPVNVVPAIVVFLVGWRVYSRFRRNIGRQPVTRGRMLARILIYAVLTLVFAAISLLLASRLAVFGGLAAGLVLGAPLGLYGLYLTRFETTPQGRFYTPNPYMGVGLSMLLVVRLAYRLLIVSGAAGQARTQPQLMQSPLTMFIFGLLAGYYMAYFIGVLVRSQAT